jgi:two-component system LytT family response regulator
MESIRTMIVDDEALARLGLRSIIEEDPEIEVIAECGDGKDAVRCIFEQKPDLVFLDVEMPEMNGFEVLEALNDEAPPVVVFSTAYDKYALKAFRVHAVDYLLKPTPPEQVMEALERAKDSLRRRKSEGDDGRLKALLADVRNGSDLQRIMVRTGGKVVLLRTEDVDWFEAEGDYVCLHCQGKKHLVRSRISDFEGRLPGGDFVRIHRSTIVNTSRIKEMQPLYHGDYVVLLHDGTRLTMTRSYREKVFQRLAGSA